MKILLVFLGLFYSIHTEYYDSASQQLLSEEEIQTYIKENKTTYCMVDIEPCSSTEGMRLDGSCNDLNDPPSGAILSPYGRLLPAVFSEGYKSRKASCGAELPLPRALSTDLLITGSVLGPQTQLFTYFIILFLADQTSQHDTINYLQQKTYCCSEEGKNDSECVPNLIPDDDPVFRFSQTRCMNMTQPKTYQSVGCTAKISENSIPSRIKPNTPSNILQFIYGHNVTKLNEYRMLEKGQLKYEMLDGKMWPPSTKTDDNDCRLNEGPTETRCHDTPASAINSLVSINFCGIMLWRYHNYVASELYKVNPCWSDQKLFETARDITIAIILQIYYYELLPTCLGKENLLKEKIITMDPGFRETHNPLEKMYMTMEYQYVMRWFHGMQNGQVEFYDENGSCQDELPIGNMTFRTGFLALEKKLEQIARGSILQAAGAADYVVDPIIQTMALGSNQITIDLMTNDMAKGRLFGLDSYVAYKALFGQNINCWEDLHGVINAERLQAMKHMYKDVKDIDLMAGVWLENHVKGGIVPQILYDIAIEQLKRNIVANRFWYESPTRPNAYTLDQLLEIRKANVAKLLCTCENGITKIQRNAFMMAGPGNELVKCSEIEQIDFSKWKDPACEQSACQK